MLFVRTLFRMSGRGDTFFPTTYYHPHICFTTFAQLAVGVYIRSIIVFRKT